MSAGTKTRVTKNYPKKLGIIAGGGDIPAQLIHACNDLNVQPVVVGLEGFATPTINPDLWARIGTGERIVQFFKHEKVNDVVFIGSVTKPNIFNLWPDFKTFIFFLKVWIRSFGDSKILDCARNELKKYGLSVRGAHEFLPNLLSDEGFLSNNHNIDAYANDIKIGILAAKELGEKDIGQAVIVKNGQVVGKEDAKGTSALIQAKGSAGAILVKMCKPQQDLNLDLPTIGINTIELCHKMKMAGIVIDAQKSLIVDKPKVKQYADKHGLFVYGVTTDA